MSPLPSAAETFTWGSGPEWDVVDSVRRAALDTDGVAPLDEAALLELKHHGVSRATLLLADRGEGFALLRSGHLDLVVTPAARSRGVGTALLRAAMRLGVSHVWSHGDHPAGGAFAERFGFTRSRELWVMRRSLSDLPAVPSVPGVVIEPWDPARESALLAVNAAAFASHPEQGEMDQANLRARMAEPWFRAEDLLLAVAGEELAGFHWTKRHSASHGEVYVVAVAPTFAGRGLGRLLTLAGLHHLADAGLSDVLLFVDATNTPAVRLYTRLGFTHSPDDTHVEYTRHPTPR